jgi:hypothetical protein
VNDELKVDFALTEFEVHWIDKHFVKVEVTLAGVGTERETKLVQRPVLEFAL